MRTLKSVAARFSVRSIVMVVCALSMVLIAFACRGRFPGCETDEECKKHNDGRETCFEKTCLQCRYDPDCEPLGSGLVCNPSTNECETMGGGKPKKVDTDAGAAEDDAGTDGATANAEPGEAPMNEPEAPAAAPPSKTGKAGKTPPAKAPGKKPKKK